MGWDEIRFFHSLAENGSLERAARTLGVGVGTVHRRVAALEAELGVRLFVRTRTGHALTDAGQTLHQRSTQVSAIVADVRHQIGDQGRELEGTVRVTTTQSAADYMLLPKLSELNREHPQLALELEAMPEIVSLIDERPSVALRFRRPERGNVVVRRLGDLSCSLYASAALADEIKSVGPRAIARAGYIGWTRAFREIGLARFATEFFLSGPTVSIGSMNGHLGAAALGLGVAHLPRFVAAAEPSLVDLQPETSTLSLRAWLVVPQSLRHVRRVNVAADFVAGAVEAAIRRESLDAHGA